MKKRKDFSFAQFFRPYKSPQPRRNGEVPKHSKRQGKLAWDSAKHGTYVRSIHGKLKTD